MQTIPPEVMSRLLQNATLSDAEVQARLTQAFTADHWRSLAPDAHVCAEAPPATDGVSVDVNPALALIAEDGYFVLRRVVPEELLRRTNAAIDQLRSAGWPPLFAWVYDETWLCTRVPSVVAVVEGALGRNAVLTSQVFTHVVPAIGGSAGWGAHVDAPGGGRLTVWIALTEANLDNGCMHVVRRRQAPANCNDRVLGATDWAQPEVLSLLHGVRALPAAPGDAMGWASDVIHWGGRTVNPQSERRSLSFEFISADKIPTPNEVPVHAFSDPLPTLEERLSAIAGAILQYDRFEPLIARFKGLAQAIRDSR
jgi:hypothetical protein